MCSKPVPLFLLRDTTLLSERDGSPSIYWSDRSTWEAFRGARGGEVVFNLLSSIGSPEIKLFAQESIDGVTWTNLPDSDNTIEISSVAVPMGLLGAAIDPDTYASGSTRIAFSHRLGGAPFVRIGVQIEDTSSDNSQVEARLTLAITPCSNGGDVPVAIQTSIDASFPAVSEQVGPVFSGIDVDAITFVSSITKSDGEGFELKLQTASDPNGTWVDTGTTISFTTSGTNLTSLDSASKSVLGTWLRLVGVTALTNPGTLGVIATCRMR